MATYFLRHQNVLHVLRARETLVGRSEHCSIVLTHSKVSRMHAVFRLVEEGEGVEVLDLGSMNGTRVNGQRLRGARRVEHGDLVQVGGEVFEVVQDRAAASSGSLTSTGAPSTDQGQPSGGPESTLDAIEALIRSSDVPDRFEATERTIRTLLDNLLSRLATSGQTMDEASVERIWAVLDRLAAFMPSESVAAWREQIADRVRRLRP